MLLGKIHERQRDYDAAYEMYRSVSDLWPDDVAAKLAMARVQIERGQADRACPILRELMHHPYATLRSNAKPSGNWVWPMLRISDGKMRYSVSSNRLPSVSYRLTTGITLPRPSFTREVENTPGSVSRNRWPCSQITVVRRL